MHNRKIIQVIWLMQEHIEGPLRCDDLAQLVGVARHVTSQQCCVRAVCQSPQSSLR